MLVYVWSRRNPFVRMNIFGFNFQVRYADIKQKKFWSKFNIYIFQQVPYLPWVLLGFSVLFGNSIKVDLVGIVVGHMYFFIEDVLPRQRGGYRILKTPQFL